MVLYNPQNRDIVVIEEQHEGLRVSGVIGSGQSLSVGVQAPLSRETSPVRDSFKLHDQDGTYDTGDPEKDQLQLRPLTEPFRPEYRSAFEQYPKNVAGKTPHKSMAMQVASMAAANGAPRFLSAHSTVGVSGAPMMLISKNGQFNSYDASLYEAKALTRLFKRKSMTLEYDAIIFTHGEADSLLGREGYCDDLIQYCKDYTQDLKDVTGQKHAPILILSQEQGLVGGSSRQGRRNKVIQDQWKVQSKTSNAIVCVGPKYQYGYARDRLHLPASSYNRLGEKYGQAFYRTFVEGRPFVPLSPKAVCIEDNTHIVVKFHVLFPPLQWDHSMPQPHQQGRYTAWNRGRGFEVRDAQGIPVTIRDVAINDDKESITITLENFHLCVLGTVAYAMSADVENPPLGSLTGNQADGLIGQLCDSDPMVGAGAEYLRCSVTHGSKQITSTTGFERRAKYDIVTPNAGVILHLDEQRRMSTLDRPWKGPSCEMDLHFHHNHRNYLVSFWEDIGDD